jgi:hypothetical protein
MPLVDPVTMATLSFKTGIPFDAWSRFMRRFMVVLLWRRLKK